MKKLLFILFFLVLISGTCFAMTTEDLEQYIKQSVIAYEINENETNGAMEYYLSLLNSNFWASYKGNLNVSSYDNFLGRTYTSSNMIYISFNFLTISNENMQIVYSGTGGNGVKHGYIRTVNYNSIPCVRYTFKNKGLTGSNFSTWEFVSNDTFNLGNNTSSYPTYQSPFYFTGNVINQDNVPYYRI